MQLQPRSLDMDLEYACYVYVDITIHEQIRIWYTRANKYMLLRICDIIVCVYVCVCVYIYIYIYMCICIYGTSFLLLNTL